MEITFPILIEWATIRPLLLGYFSTVINTFFKPAPSKRVVGEKISNHSVHIVPSAGTWIEPEDVQVLMHCSSLKPWSTLAKRSKEGRSLTL
ncbi:hypothetical protein ACL1C9_07630 [Corynebacterium striatum]